MLKQTKIIATISDKRCDVPFLEHCSMPEWNDGCKTSIQLISAKKGFLKIDQ